MTNPYDPRRATDSRKTSDPLDKNGQRKLRLLFFPPKICSPSREEERKRGSDCSVVVALASTGETPTQWSRKAGPRIQVPDQREESDSEESLAQEIKYCCCSPSPRSSRPRLPTDGQPLTVTSVETQYLRASPLLVTDCKDLVSMMGTVSVCLSMWTTGRCRERSPGHWNARRGGGRQTDSG